MNYLGSHETSFLAGVKTSANLKQRLFKQAKERRKPNFGYTNETAVKCHKKRVHCLALWFSGFLSISTWRA